MSDEELLPPFTETVWDEDLEKRPDVARIIERGQSNVLQEFADHARERILTRTTIERLHRVIFAPVFLRAAGKTRGTDPDVMYDVEIGNAAMGTFHKDAAREFDECGTQLATYLASLDAHITYPLSDEDFAAVLRVAWWLHGEIVRIHPFVNGNGRTSRICVNYLAFRYGLRPIPVGNMRRYDYFAANRLYLRERKTTAYEDLFGPMMRPSLERTPSPTR